MTRPRRPRDHGQNGGKLEFDTDDGSNGQGLLCRVGGERFTRRPTTSRIPSGRSWSSPGRAATQRPSAWTMAPDSAKWRSSSPTKKGLPAVSPWTARARDNTVCFEIVPRHQRHEVTYLAGVQTAEGNTDHLTSPTQLGEHGRQRVAAVDVGVAIGAYHQQMGHRLLRQ